jgi:hypothetical protein
MVRIQPGSILLVVTLALVSPHSPAELYKWVDENGDVHFSDKALADKEKSTAISEEGKNKVQYTGRQKPGARPIMRPRDKAVPPLHLVESGYAWINDSRTGRPEKIGIYHVGKGCTTRGAIMAPEVFKRHQELLPKNFTLAHQVIDVIEELGYEIRQTQRSILKKSLKVTGGIVMLAEITAMNLKTCAPKIYQDERLKPADSIAPYKFSHNRVGLRVHWQLLDNSNQVVLYETETEGDFDGWKKPTGTGRSVGEAMQAATRNLFARQDFIDRLFAIKVAERPKPERPKPKPLWLPPPPAEEKGILTSLRDMFLPDSTRTRAQVARALVEISALKNHMLHYYQTEGNWPEDLADLGISNSTFYGSDTIDIVSFEPDGSIIAALKSTFGDNKILTLQPRIDDNFIARWNCYSNLDESKLPEICRAL